jgi:hypothetical protein
MNDAVAKIAAAQKHVLDAIDVLRTAVEDAALAELEALRAENKRYQKALAHNPRVQQEEMDRLRAELTTMRERAGLVRKQLFEDQSREQEDDLPILLQEIGPIFLKPDELLAQRRASETMKLLPSRSDRHAAKTAAATAGDAGRLFVPAPQNRSARPGDFVQMAYPPGGAEPGIVIDFDLLANKVTVEWAIDDPLTRRTEVNSEDLIVITPGAVLVTSALVVKMGGHDHVSVWSRHGLAGELVVSAGDGAHLCRLLRLREAQPIPQATDPK